ncbi:MAG: hypothetical protein RMK99_05460 [Anaerolineales bacterium]|nr:hypothetical protein [Anaerolineales bacterium]
MENTLVTVNAADLSALLQKVDDLTGEVRALTEQVEAQRRNTQALEELVQDLTPVVNQAFKTLVRELDEVDGEFTGEQLMFLLKRLLANVHRFNDLLAQLESLLDLLEETSKVGRPVFNTAVRTLDQLERKGYFVFAREGARIVDRVVTEFTEDDVRALGDNIVTILRTVKNMTQPDIMALANRAVNQLHEPEPAEQDASVWALMREINDPKVRKGLARLLRVVKTLADQPDSVRQN